MLPAATMVQTVPITTGRQGILLWLDAMLALRGNADAILPLQCLVCRLHLRRLEHLRANLLLELASPDTALHDTSGTERTACLKETRFLSQILHNQDM